MAKHKKPKGEESISPNLIPMIDIMFLLLLFFMLGADMSQRQLEDLVLPQASNVEEDKPEDNPESGKALVTLNIHHSPDKGVQCAIHANGGVCREAGHWKWAIYGQEFTKETLKDRMAIEAQKWMGKTPDPEAKTILSDLKVLIRADSTAPYGDVQKVIEICGTVKIYKIEVGAAKPAEEKKR